MSADHVEERVRAVLAEVFDLDPEQIGPGTSTETVEAWDSLQHLTVVLSLEEEFNIELDDEETVTAVSFPAITENVRRHLDMV